MNFSNRVLKVADTELAALQVCRHLDLFADALVTAALSGDFAIAFWRTSAGSSNWRPLGYSTLLRLFQFVRTRAERGLTWIELLDDKGKVTRWTNDGAIWKQIVPESDLYALGQTKRRAKGTWVNRFGLENRMEIRIPHA